MQSHSVGHRPVRVMRSDTHQVGFPEAGDFSCFEQAATMAEIGLEDVACLKFANAAKLPARRQALARSNGGANASAHLQKRVRLFGRNRLLAEQRVQVSDGA